MKARMLYGLAGAVALLGAITTTAAIAEQPMTPSTTTELMMSNSDKAFFEHAASAGMYEIQAGKLAQSNASDPKIKDFASQMVTDHTKVADDLKSLAQSKNVVLPTALSKKDQKMLDALNGKSGTAFDKLYAKQMVASHKEAVSLFDNAAKHSKDTDVKAFASKNLPTLQQHGGMAKDLKKA